MKSKLEDGLRRDWDERAGENARHFIATGESDGPTFVLSGLRDAVLILGDLHKLLRQDMRVLEVGCGIGRLMQFMAVIFDEVHGIDISEKMIEQAKAYLERFDNAHPTLGRGSTLEPFEDNYFDLVYSYVVLQHIPDKEIVRNYFREATRVLVPGGLLKFHVKTATWVGQEGYDSWNGVEMSADDLNEWNREFGLEIINTYSVDEFTAFVVARKPA